MSERATPFEEGLIETWRFSALATSFLVENLPASVRSEKPPGMPRRTIRMIAGHVHNARCMWTARLGRGLPDEVAYGLWQWKRLAGAD